MKTKCSRKAKAALLLMFISATGLLAGCSAGTKKSPVDIDLTKMSATMVYSEVFAMMYSSEDYIGKTIRMDGIAASYHDSLTGSDYYNCIVEDATACCSQGIEFQLADEDAEYPPDGKEIIVEGTFNTYIDGEYEFVALQDAKLL